MKSRRISNAYGWMIPGAVGEEESEEDLLRPLLAQGSSPLNDYESIGWLIGEVARSIPDSIGRGDVGIREHHIHAVIGMIQVMAMQHP